jgi:hypothetical protein
MNIEHENFIATYDGYFSDDFCDSLVSYFEWCKNNNRSFNRQEMERIKKDTSCVLNPSNFQEIEFSGANVNTFIGEFNDVFWNKCYSNYLETYSTLAEYDQHTIYSYKIQRTDPAGGYHIWHAEDGSKAFSRRVGVYILYLNDVEEGGETEFLYLSKRVKAKKGRLVVFPPNYPWAHRGNPPLSNSKYILTGWTEYN